LSRRSPVLLEAEQIDAGFGHVHIDGIQLLDGGESRGLARHDQGATVTLDFPMRPEIGAVTRAYPRLIRVL